jgi:hypothetical protein
LKATSADPCVFTSQSEKNKILLAIYIDDGLIIAEGREQINKILDELQKEFEITHNKVNLFLGLQIEQFPTGNIFVHQKAYARRVLQRFNMENANPVVIPTNPHDELGSHIHLTGEDECTTAPFREAIGSLMYLSVATRPDTTFAVNRVSRYLEKPKKVHWKAVKRILEYIKGTIDYGLKFESHQENKLVAYSDADYAGDTESRRSTTSEYVAACQTAKEIAWTKNLIKNLLDTKEVSTTLYLDNQSAIQLIKNPVFHKRSKHVDVRYHYIREQYERNEFLLEYTPSKEQHADILTKALARDQFQKHRIAIGMCKRPS